MCAFNAKKILNTSKLSLILRRLASQLYENHNYFENAVLIGIQPRGKILAEKLKEFLIFSCCLIVFLSKDLTLTCLY